MFVCRLFHRDNPSKPLESRVITQGQITLGRDPACDWAIDGGNTLSRVHCVLSVDRDRLMLFDRSANGVFIENGARVPVGEAVDVGLGERLQLGEYVIVVEAAEAPAAASFQPRPSAENGVRDPANGDVSLLDAFCEGAGLDPSAFAGEEPGEIIRRAGAIYLQAVKGIAALMTERARFKEAGGLARTTIGATDNNPFKWTSPRRMAEDLLCGVGEGFLANGQAVEASFEDLQRHLKALNAAARSASRLTLDQLSPASIEAEAKAQSSLLKGRSAACWEVLSRRHAHLAASGGHAEGSLDRTFAEAYRQATG